MTSSSSNGRAILRTPFTEDLPRAFNHTLPNKGTFLYGPYAQIICTFAHYHNLSLELDYMSDYRTPDIHRRIQSGYYNLTLHGSGYIENGTLLQSSYPLEWVRCCVMVPLEDELAKFWYVIWPFERYIWLTLFIAIIYTSILMRFLEDSPRSRKQARSFSHNLLQSTAILFCTSNLNVSLHNRPLRVMIFYALLFVLVFILSAFYQSHMTSYCMKPIFLPPLNSVADIQKTDLKILISINVLEELSQNIYNNLKALESHLVSTSWQEFQSKLESLNRSVGYVVPQDVGKFIQREQRYLYKPIFHMSRACIGGGFNAYPLYPNKKLADALQIHMLAVQEAGLWDFWQEQAFDVAVLAKYANILLDSYDVLPLNLEFFTIGWIVLAVGLFFSCCTLAVEYYYMRYKMRFI